jgi:thioredoxin 1
VEVKTNMAWTAILGAGIGSAVGGGLGYMTFRKTLPGVILGACLGAIVLHFVARGPRQVLAVETPEQFRAEVLQADRPVVVDFYADWCPPCRTLAPTIKELAGEYKGRVTFVKINVDEGGSLAHALNIRAIPTVMVFVDSNPVRRWCGCRPASFYRAELDAILAKR